MRHYSLLRTIPLTFYSKELYRDVFSWPGLGFAYVLFTMFLFSLPVMLYFTGISLTVGSTHAADIDYVVQQVPRMTFKGGVLSVDVTQPYYIRAPKDENGKTFNLAIIDTTRDVNEWNKPDFRGIVFGRTQALIRSKADESRLHDYPPNFDAIITSEDVRHWINVALDWLWIVPWFTLPFILMPLFVWRIIQLFIYGLFGLLIAHFTKTRTTYIQVVRLASVSITPSLALDALLTYILHIPLLGIIYFAIDMGYLCFALKANSSHA